MKNGDWRHSWGRKGVDLAVLDAALNAAKVVVVEYGSAAGTIHIGNRLKDWGRLVSVEHNPKWAEKVRPFLEEQGLDHVTLLLREPRTGKELVEEQRFSKRFDCQTICISIAHHRHPKFHARRVRR